MLVLLFCAVISAAAEDVAEDRSSSEVHYGYQRHYGYHPHQSGDIFILTFYIEEYKLRKKIPSGLSNFANFEKALSIKVKGP